jgi:hypothetical protein
MNTRQQKTLVLAFALTRPPDMPPNVRVGEIASRQALATDRTIFTQDDVPIDPSLRLTVERIRQIPGKLPPSTLRIVMEGMDYAKKHDFNSIIIVGARPHIRRCKRDVARIIAERRLEITWSVPPEIEQSANKEWYCKGHTHHRSWTIFNIRERILLYLMPFWLYKVVTSRR